MKFLLNIINKNITKAIFFITLCVSVIFYQVIFLNKTLTTGIVSEGVMGTKESTNFVLAQEKELFNTLDRGGSAWQDEPLTIKVSNAYKNHSLPLWNKNAGFGKPLAADMMSAAFSIYKLPMFINNSPVIFDAMLILRIILGGIFMCLFLKKIKISTLASVTGGLIYILSGYFVYYSNMGHLNVEIMIPLLFYSVERIFEKKSFFNYLLFVFTIVTMILGGHPESLVIAIVFSTLYFIYKLFREKKKKKESFKTIAVYVLGIILAIGLVCFLVVPFIEYYINSDLGIHNSDYKLYANSFPLYYFALQFFPILIQSSLTLLNNNYWSSIILFLVSVGLFDKKFRSVYIYFLIFSVFAIFKVYSEHFFGWIGFVPIFNNFVYYKYLQPGISFSFAVMACIGLEYLKNNSNILKACLTGILALVVTYSYLYLSIDKVHYAFGPKRLFGALAIPLFLLVFYLVLKIVDNKISFIKYKKVSYIFLCFIAVFELLVFSPKSRPLRGDVYSKPEYVDFLKKDKEPFRIFSTSQIMYPATSSVFNIDDIRDLHAVYPRLYVLYIKNFIDNSIADRFSEYGDSTNIMGNKFFDMANIKYVLSYKLLNVDINASLTKKIIDQSKLDLNSSLAWFNIDRKTKIVLFEHPPGKIKYKLLPKKDTSLLSFSVGMDPRIWDPKYGNGVLFQIKAIVDNENYELYRQFIDPKNNLSDRKWFDGSVDLSSFINKEIILEFITSADNSNAYGWAGWGNLKLSPFYGDNKDVDVTKGQFTEIYNNEILIYKNNNSFPRAYVVRDFILHHDEESTIRAMKSVDFDPRTTAIITSKDELLPNEQNIPQQENLNYSDSVEFIQQEDTKLVLNTLTESDSYLVISNIFYPGWEAYIDGKKVNIFQTNLAFSGLFLPKGNHRVIFKYDPFSYKLGLFISIFSLSIITIALIKNKKN